MLLRLLFLGSLAAGLLAAASPVPSSAHGGYPMSIGAVAGSELGPVLRLTLVYLREGQGMTVEPLFFESAGEMDEAYGKGKADLLLRRPGGVWAQENCAAAGTIEEKGSRSAARIAGDYPGAWTAPFSFTLPDGPCPPVLVAHSRVSGDLRFTLLRSALERLLRGIDGEAVSRFLRDGGGDPRREVEAARKILGEKGLL